MTEQHTRQQQHYTFGCNDVGNSERFIRKHGNEVKYITEYKKWAAHDGQRWNVDDAKTYDRAKSTANSIYAEASQHPDDSKKAELGRWANTSSNKGRLDAMLALAADGLSVSASEFDTDPDVINCQNGLLDLKTGALHPHSPEQRVIKIANASYDNQAVPTRWLQFLEEVFQKDVELISYMQKAFGYCLTGRTDEQCFFLPYGLGSNGKTTMFETVLDVLGDYGITMEFGTFLNADKTSVRTQEAVGKLMGRRFAIATETASNKKFDEATIKKVTGGDTLTGAKLYGGSYDFKPTHKIFLSCNHRPSIKDATTGMWRRVVVLPFNANFTGDNLDRDLLKKLLSERDGIFSWMAQGSTRYYKEGLEPVPEIIHEAVEEYRYDNDILSRFIEDCLQTVEGGKCYTQETYKAYQDWCEKTKEPSIAINFFVSGLRERGVRIKKINTGNAILDMNLKGRAEVFEPREYRLVPPPLDLPDWVSSQPKYITKWQDMT